MGPDKHKKELKQVEAAPGQGPENREVVPKDVEPDGAPSFHLEQEILHNIREGPEKMDDADNARLYKTSQHGGTLYP